MRLQDWSAAPSPPASHTALCVPKSISAPRNGLWPWGAEDVLRRAPALPGGLAQTPVPSPSPSELLTARAVEQLHDPEAVVQQCFGPHQLQASRRTQEVQHCFHLGADLHALGGRKALGPQVPPSARAEIPRELAGVRLGWANSSCLERGDQNTQE